jgi:hypothetical protein
MFSDLYSALLDAWDAVTHLIRVEPRAIPQSAYSPQPNSIAGSTRVPLNVDPLGNLMVRGQITTDEGSFADDFPGAALATALTGSVAFTNASLAIVGTATAFTTELSRDSYVKLDAHAETAWARVASITDDTHATLETAYAGVTASGASSKQGWATVTPAGGSRAVANSVLAITHPLGNGLRSTLYRKVDYGPIAIYKKFSISQRVANQVTTLGLVDSPTTFGVQALFVFDGAANTTVKARTGTGAAASAQQETTITLPGGITTATDQVYSVRVYSDKVVYYVNDVQVAVHRYHLPGPYITLYAVLDSANSAAIGLDTTLSLDDVHIENLDRVDVTAVQPDASKLHVRVDQLNHYTLVAPDGGASSPDVTILAAGGAAANYWAIEPFTLYELKLLPDTTNAVLGAPAPSDFAVGGFLLHPSAAPASYDVCWPIQNGTAPIYVTSATRLYVWGLAVANCACRFKLRRVDR